MGFEMEGKWPTIPYSGLITGLPWATQSENELHSLVFSHVEKMETCHSPSKTVLPLCAASSAHIFRRFQGLVEIRRFIWWTQ